MQLTIVCCLALAVFSIPNQGVLQARSRSTGDEWTLSWPKPATITNDPDYEESTPPSCEKPHQCACFAGAGKEIAKVKVVDKGEEGLRECFSKCKNTQHCTFIYFESNSCHLLPNCDNSRVPMVQGVTYKARYTYHLNPAGKRACDTGNEVPKGSCEHAVKTIHSNIGRSLSVCRITPPSSYTCFNWKPVPTGCSTQSGGDWAAHYRYSHQDSTCTQNTKYQLICKNSEGKHVLAAKGAGSCSGVGQNVPRAECEAAAKGFRVSSRKMSVEPRTTCFDWLPVPKGCSTQSGGDWAPHFKSFDEDINQCTQKTKYSLVCATPLAHP